MGLAAKQIYHNQKSVTKREFEKAYVELMDNIRIIDQRLSTKADEVVLTMSLAHRQEIEELQSEVVELHRELKQIKNQNAKRERTEKFDQIRRNNTITSWFKKMQIARK
ncbi:hypothetical protein [Aquibacillus kalidii]|uniref:hypothetical protein n=1 Tax=Aquibacillus kalidii TaxID=2762597 RepID=UPI0016475A01|nr:hypothetical protein [Aquibacillus kalidii]